MGPGSESTLRIDEPLHLMFLVAYLITYFCCAYILFVCFKHCRRLVQRKPSRPVSLSRLRSVAEALNNLPCRMQSSRVGGSSSRQVQVSLCNLGGTHAVLYPQSQLRDEGDGDADGDVSQASVDTNSSRLSPLQMTTFTFRRIYYRGQHAHHHAGPFAWFIVDDGESGGSGDEDDLPQYEAVSKSCLPPSYSTCVLSTQVAAAAAAATGAGQQNTCNSATAAPCGCGPIKAATTTSEKVDRGSVECECACNQCDVDVDTQITVTEAESPSQSQTKAV